MVPDGMQSANKHNQTRTFLQCFGDRTEKIKGGEYGYSCKNYGCG